MVENATTINLRELIGKGYKSFWNWKGRYLVVKGSRGSKKSTTAAFKVVMNIMRYPKTNALVIRRYDITHRESTFAQLKWAINRMGVAHLWRASLSPMQLTYTPTGQRIIFRGMDDPQSIASITIEDGYLTWVWIEEAYQIEKEEDFDKLDLSIRGVLPSGLYKQFILTFNPWDSHHWLKARFFDDPDEDTLALTTNYMCNEWLGQDDIAIFDRMKETSPRRYQVEGLGEWGITDGLIYENWELKSFDWRQMAIATDDNGYPLYEARYGMDFGFSTDPTAFVAVLVSTKRKELYIFDEWYKHGATNQQIADALRHKEFHKTKIIADSEDPRTINELYLLGLSRITGAQKGPDSVRAGIQRLQDYKIYVHPSCHNIEIELANHCWEKNRQGQLTGRPAPDGYHHLLDALRYATEDIGSEKFSF